MLWINNLFEQQRTRIYIIKSNNLIIIAFDEFNRMCVPFCGTCQLWSQIIYGHRTASFHKKSYDSTAPVRCPAGGRKNRTILYHVLDIVRCPVNFRYYLKFHGARTAFGRVIEGKITSDGHRTVPGRRPAGVFTHRTGTGWFLFNIYIVRFQRRPAGHRTMSDKRQELSKVA